MRDLFSRINRLEQQAEQVLEQPETPAWQDWTPTLTQSSSVDVQPDFQARYILYNKIAIVQVSLEVDVDNGVAGNNIIVGGLPSIVAPAFSGTIPNTVGVGTVRDSGTTIYVVAVIAESASSFSFLVSGNLSKLGTSPSFALAEGDDIGFTATYEVG